MNTSCREAINILSNEECKLILENACPEKQFNILSYRFESIDDLVEGFLSDSKKLIIEYSVDNVDKKQEKVFFAKLLPFKNEFHIKYVLSTRGFNKEVFFFDNIKPNLDLWSDRDVLPKCYLAVPDKIIVLELLLDWKVKDTYQFFNEKETKASIEALAILHSSSIMCETKNSMDFKSIWGEYFFETLYLNEEGHLGYIHTCNGVKALKAIIDFLYPSKSETKENIFHIFDSIPELVLPSTKYRNVISHGDLYNNNIMFLSNSSEMSNNLPKIVNNSVVQSATSSLYPKLTGMSDSLESPIATVNEIEDTLKETSAESSALRPTSSKTNAGPTRISASSSLYPNLAEIRAELNEIDANLSGTNVASLAEVSISKKINSNPIEQFFDTKQLNFALRTQAKIIDFQLFRFNPPALDLLMLIYLTSDLNNLNLNNLTDHYYKCVCDCLTKFGFDINIELPRDEFDESVSHYRSLALCFALLFRHYVNLPPDTLKSIMGDPVELKKFMLEDRIETCLSAFQNDTDYRNILISTINVLFNLFDK